MFWEDDISKKLTEAGRKNTGTLWKVSNLFAVPAVLAMLALIGGIVLLIVAASATFLFGPSPTTDTIKNVVPVIALLLFIAAGVLYLFFLVYAVIVAAIAFDFGDVWWGAANLLIGITAPFYKYFKAKEIREKGLQLKELNNSPAEVEKNKQPPEAEPVVQPPAPEPKKPTRKKVSS